MKINIKNIKNLPNKSDTIVLTIFEKQKIQSSFFQTIDKSTNSKLTQLIKEGVITGKKENITLIYPTPESMADKIVILGLGPQKTLTYDNCRAAAGNLVRFLTKIKSKQIQLILDNNWNTIKLKPDLIASAITEGLILGAYQFDEYKKTETKPTKIASIDLVTASPITTQIRNAQSDAKIIAAAQNTARDLANQPSNVLTPSKFVEISQKLLENNSQINQTIIDKKEAEKLGLNAFLGVAKGSAADPFLLIIEYNGAKNSDKPIGLIGKGVTFDSGGISLKPSANMEEMKGDMSGAAAVLTAIKALAELNIKINIVGVIPLVENMPSGTAQKPGDIVRAMNGKTIEIINTDAEGRLILIDAICYAIAKKNVKSIIDIATLTGACSITLGDIASAILGNNQPLIDQMLTIAQYTGERLWQLPLYDEYLDYLKSDVADLANCATKKLAGTANAAKFIQQFVGKTPWIHLDIASTCHATKTAGYTIKGMTGSGTRNLIRFIQKI